MGPELEIPLSDLVSPYKQNISISSVADWERWQSVLDEVVANTYSPILVEKGSGGVRLEDVEIA
jgi:hypothetical protein